MLTMLSALLLAGAVQSEAPASPPAKPEKPQCRRVAAATGSIMPAKPVCHSKAEWAAIDASQGDGGDVLNASRRRDAMRGATGAP